MVNFLINLFISMILGFLAGMGVGGGSLLLLWLTQVASMAQPQARILNLLFYLPAALICSMLRRKKNLIRRDITLPALGAGCAFALIFTLLSRNWEVTILQKLLGGLLVIIGIREICYRPRKAI